jgi:hypothetical protein
MKLRIIFILLSFITLYSCTNLPNNETEVTPIDSAVNNSTNAIPKQTRDASPILDKDVDSDTITTLKFDEFSLSINRLIIYDDEKRVAKVKTDTVEIYAELGETIEGQVISISSDLLRDFTVEQRYETSLTIMNEGPHCDLTDWKHFNSDWKRLKSNTKGQFICDKYTEKDYEKFISVSIDQIQKQVKEQCGEEWFKLVENIKSPTEYPSGVGISRYYLKVTGYRKDNGELVQKLIVIENPMGC